MYGDSITWEAQKQLTSHSIEVHSYGGTAICDWFSDMQQQAATGTVKKVYLEFVGNNFTSCITSRPLLAAYTADSVKAVQIWHAKGVRVVWVRPPEPRLVPALAQNLTATARRPTNRSEAEAAAVPSFDEVQAALQRAGADAYVDTSPLIAPGRVYAEQLACIGTEPCGVLAPAGFDKARAEDGMHLCPVAQANPDGTVSSTCAVWATSENRFADQVAKG
jgi:hypothetical protein